VESNIESLAIVLTRSMNRLVLMNLVVLVLLSCTGQDNWLPGASALRRSEVGETVRFGPGHKAELIFRLDAPYPPSPMIGGIFWDFDEFDRYALGSDLWPVTWADDDALYGVWGDGGGFGGLNKVGRVSLGVARIAGLPGALEAKNVFGGQDAQAPATFIGKSHAIISIDGEQYMWVEEQGKWMRGKVGKSTDRGKTWRFKGGKGSFQDSDWTFEEPGGVFADPALLQFGRDYHDARDGYVYGYSERVRNVAQTDIVMFRVPKDRLMDRTAYEFFAGFDGTGAPVWTSLINKMKPVFSDPNGVAWGVQVMYHPRLKRYLMTVRPEDNGSAWGIFDAPEPWGPWTTVAYYSKWLDASRKIMYVFNPKWISSDGRTMYMIFSGSEHDAFNVIKATLNLNPRFESENAELSSTGIR
jgi:Domain of unknown function (DUF4185)